MFLINTQSNEPIYEQIKRQIVRFVEAGVLQPDEKLISVRSLAQQLNINPNTVQKAYQELEVEGVLCIRCRKKGCLSAAGLRMEKFAVWKRKSGSC